MTNLIISLLLLCAIETCTSCSSNSAGSVASTSRAISSNPTSGGNTAPQNLRFRKGDIISCDIVDGWGASHIMLATSERTVIHAPGPDPDGPTDQTQILQQDLTAAASHYKECKVITESYDKDYHSGCDDTPFDVEKVVQRANESVKKFRGQTTHYDKFKCNCEHWVSAWRYGTSWTLQTKIILHRTKFRSDDCQAPGLMQCPSG